MDRSRVIGYTKAKQRSTAVSIGLPWFSEDKSW